MRSLSTDFQAHLDSGVTTLCWCWRIVRADGQVFGFTDHDRTLVFDGTSFEPDSGLSATELRNRADLSVDTQDAEGALSSSAIAESDILAGMWDNASVEVWRVNWTDTDQRIRLRRGSIGEVRRGRVAFVAEVRSMAHVLNQPFTRTFQHHCDAVLGDSRCGVNLADSAYQGSGTVAGVLRDRAFTATGIDAFDADHFSLGTLTWTSGANNTRQMEVLRHDKQDSTVTITLLDAPPETIAVIDTFTIQAGCDKRIETCNDKFSNTANFRGFPHIPGQDTVFRYATRKGGHDGDVL